VNAVDLYWLPLGAGGRVVKWNGRLYEAFCARRDHLPRLDLYHAALSVVLHDTRYAIEMAPAWGSGSGAEVASEGPVFAGPLGRSRLFRYEIRRRENGSIPDIDFAVASPVRVSANESQSTAVLELTGQAPPLTWGRDEIGAFEMWNSNSLVAWLLARSSHDMTGIALPPNGSAPGWSAGLVLAARQGAVPNSAIGPPTSGTSDPVGAAVQRLD
jgi:hypothetical protein